MTYADDTARAHDTIPKKYEGQDVWYILEQLQSVVASPNNLFWEDLRFPAQGINPPGAVGDPSIDTTNGLLVFAGNADNLIAGIAQLPHAWAQGTALSPHVHLLADAAASGNQRWKIEWEFVPIGDTWDGSTYTGSEIVTFDSGSNQSTHKLVPFADWDMSSFAAVSICVMWRVSRLASSDAADTDTTACTFLEFDIHYQTDGPGSRAEQSK